MNSRQEFICDVVEHYKKNYSEDYKAFLKATKKKKEKVKYKSTARFAFGEGRHLATIPEGLYMALDVFNKPRFLEEEAEQRWFAKKYPEFLVPTTY